MRQDDVRRERDQLRRMPASVVGVASGPADVDAHVAADDPARLRERLLERPDPGLVVRIVGACGDERADAPHALALLGLRSERPTGRRATDERDELPSLHRLHTHADDRTLPYHLILSVLCVTAILTPNVGSGSIATDP